LAAAPPLFERALVIFDGALGPEHPSANDSAHVTANALAALGRAEEAKALLAKCGIDNEAK